VLGTCPTDVILAHACGNPRGDFGTAARLWRGMYVRIGARDEAYWRRALGLQRGVCLKILSS
jgi:hypothetical protein